MSPRLVEALRYAEQGIKIFPCRPGTKFPVFKEPFANATTDPQVIRGWFETIGDVNIAYCPEDNGRCVADIDMKNGKDGLASWLALPFEKPLTYTVETPTGGLHYHYLGSLRPTAGRIAEGVDTRGIRSLAVLPPSITPDGEYVEIIPPECIAPVPDGLVELARPKDHAKLEAPEGFELDMPWNVELVRDKLNRYVRKGDIGMPGAGNQRTYDLAVEVLDYGISPLLAFELIGELWNPHTVSPRPDDELAAIIDNAVKYRQNAIGARAHPDPAVLLAAAGVEPNPTHEATQGRRRFETKWPAEDAEEPPLDYWDDHRDKRILPRMPGGCAIVAYGASGSHKSGLILKELADAVLNKGARVLYIAAEGAHGIKRYRLPELMRQRGQPIADLTGQWRTLGATLDILDPGDLAELFIEFQDYRPNIVAIDTVTRCIGAADLNSPTVGTNMIQALEKIGARWDATVIGVTHPSKDGPERGAIGSIQQGNQAFGEWVVEYDGAGTVSLLAKKMKEGEAGFTLPMKVNTDGVPVVKEMTPEERRIALRMAAPRHDEIRTAVYRVAFERLQAGGEVVAKNLGSRFGPLAILGCLKDEGFRNATEKDVREALAALVGVDQLAGGDGDGYRIGTAATEPSSLQ